MLAEVKPVGAGSSPGSFLSVTWPADLLLSPELFCSRLVIIFSASMLDMLFMTSASCFSSSDVDPVREEGRNRRLFMVGSFASGFLSREITDFPDDVIVFRTDGRVYVPMPWDGDDDMNGFMLPVVGLEDSAVACSTCINFWMLI